MKTLSILFLTLITALQASCQLPYWGTPNPVSPPSSTCRTYEITSTTVHTVQYEYQGCDGGTTIGYISGIGQVKEICALVGTVNWSPSSGSNGNVTVANRKCCTCTYPTGTNFMTTAGIRPSEGPAGVDGTIIQNARVDFYNTSNEVVKTLYLPTHVEYWNSTAFNNLITTDISQFQITVTLKRVEGIPNHYDSIWATASNAIGTGGPYEWLEETPHFTIPPENVGQEVEYTYPKRSIALLLRSVANTYALRITAGPITIQ